MSTFARFTAETRKLTIFDHEYRTLAVDVVPYATPLPAALAAFGYALLTSDPLWSDDVYELAPLPTDATPTPAPQEDRSHGWNVVPTPQQLEQAVRDAFSLVPGVDHVAVAATVKSILSARGFLA